MFKTEYIYELISGQLSGEGYKHFLSVVSYYVKKYNWPKSIIVSSEIKQTKFWSFDEIKELTHQFFEWSLDKGKFDHLNKIPENYLSYYLSQILISFVANRIKEEQQKNGLSFERCRELVISICKDDYIINTFKGKEYVFTGEFSSDEIQTTQEAQDAISYLSRIPLNESTKHFRPLVKLAIEDIFNTIDKPIQINKLIEIVYSLFDQKGFNYFESSDDPIREDGFEISSLRFEKIIHTLLSNLTKEDARLFSYFLFKNEEKQSLADLANKFNVPKSTLHYKIESFKKKISLSYTPENEEDGICFMQNLARSLDELAK